VDDPSLIEPGWELGVCLLGAAWRHGAVIWCKGAVAVGRHRKQEHLRLSLVWRTV
jgi:hypothetical protein